MVHASKLTWGLAALALAAASAATEPRPSPFAALSFLVGHCWKGSFPGGQVTDEHCFSWIYGDKFVRDRHVVRHGDGQPDDLGESIYVWDAPAGELQYLYIESGGGFSRGSVAREADALVFPPTRYSENGKEQTYRSRWQKSGASAYEVVTEFLVNGQWQPGFTLHMQRQPGPAG